MEKNYKHISQQPLIYKCRYKYIAYKYIGMLYVLLYTVYMQWYWDNKGMNDFIQKNLKVLCQKNFLFVLLIKWTFKWDQDWGPNSKMGHYFVRVGQNMVGALM